MFAFILPLVLFKITREPIAIWFYFSASSFFWGLITASYFAQTLGFIIVLGMYFVKWPARVILLALCILTHSTMFFVGLAFLLLLSIQDYLLSNKKWVEWLMAACSPFWGQVPKQMEETVIETKMVSAHSLDGAVTINTLLSVIAKRTPLPFLWFSVKELVKRREIALLGLLLFMFIAGFTYHDRAFHFAALPMVCGLSWYYSKTSRKMKLGLLLLSGAYFVFNLQQLVSLAIYCG